MATLDLTEETFKDTITTNPIVLIDFWASWCGPCRNFAPVYESVSEQNPDIVFAKVDTEAQQGLAGAFQISAIPTLVVIRDGVVLHSQPGALPEAGLVNVINAVREVDMDEVRASIAAEKTTEDPAEGDLRP
jgi:thioredoxin 1